MQPNTAFALPTESDELNELASLGIDLDKPMSDADLKALASEQLRLMGEAEQEYDRIADTKRAELARIQMRYDAQLESAQKRIDHFQGIVREIAKRVDYGKKKSAKVGYGTFGKKDKAERIEVVDQEKAVASVRALKLSEKDAIKTTEKVVHAFVAPVVLKHMKDTGEVLDGFEHHEADTEYYAKPEYDE